MLFEVVILENPTKKNAEEGELPSIKFGPKLLVARDAQNAAMQTVMDNAAALKSVAKDRMEVIVRNFQ